MRELDSFDADDRLWLKRVPAPQGRFNAGQKVNAALTAAFAVLFAGSGFLLWLGERDVRFRFASTIVLHDGLMWISLVLLVGHLHLAVLNPATRHSLRGMTRGSVKASWAARHHRKWLTRATPNTPIADAPLAPSSRHRVGVAPRGSRRLDADVSIAAGRGGKWAAWIRTKDQRIMRPIPRSCRILSA